MKHLQIIFILGTTGVGKTKLSIELAKAYNGEVVSCDSKQLYKDISIMTAKITSFQAQGIPHHLIDCLNLSDTCYNRIQYFAQALPIIKDIRSRGKLPIVVGGTNYYIEPLLYKIDMKEDPFENCQEGKIQSKNRVEQEKQQRKALTNEQKQGNELLALSKQEKYDLLTKLDPVMARRVHPNNQKKVSIYLERCLAQKRPVSETYKPYCNELRQSNSLILWLRNSDKEELKNTITKRINKMLLEGGVAEIIALYVHLEYSFKCNIRQGNGVMSSIGIQQFAAFYEAIRQELKGIFLQKDSFQIVFQKLKKYPFDISSQVFEKCKQDLIIHTLQYCKRQITWLKNRIFVNCNEANQHLFVLEIANTNIKNNKSTNQINCKQIIQNYSKQDLISDIKCKIQNNEQKILNINTENNQQHQDKIKQSQNSELKRQQKDNKIQQKNEKTIEERFQLFALEKAMSIIKNIQMYGFGYVKEDKTQFLQKDIVPLKEWQLHKCEICDKTLNGQEQWDYHLKSKKHILKEKKSKKTIVFINEIKDKK